MGGGKAKKEEEKGRERKKKTVPLAPSLGPFSSSRQRLDERRHMGKHTEQGTTAGHDAPSTMVARVQFPLLGRALAGSGARSSGRGRSSGFGALLHIPGRRQLVSLWAGENGDGCAVRPVGLRGRRRGPEQYHSCGLRPPILSPPACARKHAPWGCWRRPTPGPCQRATWPFWPARRPRTCASWRCRRCRTTRRRRGRRDRRAGRWKGKGRRQQGEERRQGRGRLGKKALGINKGAMCWNERKRGRRKKHPSDGKAVFCGGKPGVGSDLTTTSCG